MMGEIFFDPKLTTFLNKDALPEICSSCLIYKYTSYGCNTIGKTERTFLICICKHRVLNPSLTSGATILK